MEARQLFPLLRPVEAFSTAGEVSLSDAYLFSPRLWLTMSYSQMKRRQLVAESVVETLVVDLLQWMANGERNYEEVMDAWRTSCPKLPVWEDANDRGLITRERVNGRTIVRVSPLGLALLEKARPTSSLSGSSNRP
jgi:hypothetical protein